MTVVPRALSAQALGMAAREFPSASRHHHVGTLAASGPTKVVGLVNRASWSVDWPTDLWGTCGLTRSDRRDGDGKAPGRQNPRSTTD